MVIKDLDVYKKYTKSMDELLTIIEKSLKENSEYENEYNLCMSLIKIYSSLTDEVLEDVTQLMFDPNLSSRNKNAKSYLEYTPVEKILFTAVNQIIQDVESNFIEKLNEDDYETLRFDPNFNIILYSLDNIVFLLFLDIMDYTVNNKILKSHNYLSYPNVDLDFGKYITLYIFNNLN